MHLHTLRVENLRVFDAAEVALEPGWNLFVGANGAGKTTLLEAAFLLSHGRSFRTAQREALVRNGQSAFSVFGELERNGRRVRVGLARQARRLEARVDGESVVIGDLLRRTAVVCFEPGSHALVAGAADERRRYLDWGVFHVEHDFLAVWRRCHRALRQRNALLRQGVEATALAAWEHEFARAAEPLAAMRARYFERLAPGISAHLAALVPELGAVALELDHGFDAGTSLEAALAARRARDLVLGHTGIGPHRADFRIRFEHAPRREHLSRGQQKLAALALVLAQAQAFAEHAGEWPVLCLDDIASEVDGAHQQRVLAAVAATAAQVLLTATDTPAALADHSGPLATFHVEHGEVRRLL